MGCDDIGCGLAEQDGVLQKSKNSKRIENVLSLEFYSGTIY